MYIYFTFFCYLNIITRGKNRRSLCAIKTFLDCVLSMNTCTRIVFANNTTPLYCYYLRVLTTFKMFFFFIIIRASKKKKKTVFDCSFKKINIVEKKSRIRIYYIRRVGGEKCTKTFKVRLEFAFNVEFRNACNNNNNQRYVRTVLHIL